MTTLATEAVAAQCRGTPGVQVLDNRGLAVRALQYNRNVADEAATQLMTRQRYTATGQLLSSLDPRLGADQQLDPTLPPNFSYVASLSSRPLRTQSQDAGTTVQLSDIEGGPIWQRASRGQCTHWRYDALHRPTLMFEQAAANEPERISERYTYADGPAIAAAANCRGRLVAQHDTAGLNEVRRYSLGGQAQLSVRRLLRAEVPASDWQGEETAWETALEQQAYTSRQGFDALGRINWSLDAKGNRQQPQFNVTGQLFSSQLTLAGQSSSRVLLRRVRYSAAGQVQWEEAGNGVVSDYRYEPQTQRLSQLTVSRPAQSGRATLLQDLNYDYDPVGNILAISDAAQPTRYHNNQRIAPTNQYQYDALYQLLSASGRENADAGQQGLGLPIPEVPISADPNRYSNYTRSYSYDRGGNLTQIRHQGSKNYTQELVVAPTSNRAVQQTGFLTPADVDGHFDAAGNLQQLAPGQPLAWDGRNQLQEVVQVQRDAGPDDREWYRYDGGGQRVQKTSVSQTSATQRQAEVIYLPGLELRRTRSLQGDTETTVEDLQVIRGQAVGRAQVRVLHWEIGQPETIPNDQVRYSRDNQIGSSLLELDLAADILTLEEYFPFGGTAVWSGKNLSETQYKFVRYSGKERDATGLYYYGFRYYAPWLGRWLNPDPAGTVDGLNLFRMVRNNPIKYKDSNGLISANEVANAIILGLVIIGVLAALGMTLGTKIHRSIQLNDAGLDEWKQLKPNQKIVHTIRGDESDFYTKPVRDVLDQRRDILSASLIDINQISTNSNTRQPRYTGTYAEVGFILEAPAQNIIGTHEHDISFPNQIGVTNATTEKRKVAEPYKLSDTIMRPPILGYSYKKSVLPRISSYHIITTPNELLARGERIRPTYEDPSIYRNELLVVAKPGVNIYKGRSETRPIKVSGIISVPSSASGMPDATDLYRINRLRSANRDLPTYIVKNKTLTLFAPPLSPRAQR